MKVYYWSPFISKVATASSVIRSAESLKKYSKQNISVSLIDAIGEWDQYAIRYGYTQFAENEDEQLNDIISEWIDAGYQYIMDSDARPQSGAHAQAHLWDGGTNAASELNRLADIRSKVLSNFSETAIHLCRALGVPFLRSTDVRLTIMRCRE